MHTLSDAPSNGCTAGPSALRRSTRLQAKTVATSMKGVAAVSDCDSEPPSKRRKSGPKGTSTSTQVRDTVTVTGRGKRKSLSKLPDMPLDILFEVWGHLHPYDLLRLARTTKVLRGILMSRSSVTIWRQARTNLPDLPECPSDLTEPAYANLLFDPHCHFCVKARVMTVMWACRLRCCKPCLKDNFVELIDVFKSVGPSWLKPGAMLPTEQINNRLHFPKAKLAELIERIAECNNNEEALKALEEQRIQAVIEQEKNAELLEEWQLTQTRKRALEKIDLRSRRQQQIIDRLSNLGYAKDLEYMTVELFEQFVDHPQVRQPKEVTDRIWNNIKELMITFAEEARAERLMREHCVHYLNRLRVVRDTVKEFLADHPLWVSLPSIADFSWYAPVFREIMEKDRGAFYAAVNLPANVLSVALMDVVTRWRKEMGRRLYEMIPPDARGDTSEDAAEEGKGKGRVTLEAGEVPYEKVLTRLCSATTWFRCTVNGCLLDYPRVLSHHCARTGPAVNNHPTTDADNLANAYNVVLKEFPWNFTGDKIVFDADAMAAAEKVVRVQGFDPRYADNFELDAGQPRFACGECSRDGQVCVMPWRAAVDHLCRPDHKGRDVKLTLLNPHDTLAVLERESARTAALFRDVYKLWGCVECRGPPMALRDIIGHCIVEHDNETPDVEDDFEMHADADTAMGVPADELFYPSVLFTSDIQH